MAVIFEDEDQEEEEEEEDYEIRDDSDEEDERDERRRNCSSSRGRVQEEDIVRSITANGVQGGKRYCFSIDGFCVQWQISEIYPETSF